MTKKEAREAEKEAFDNGYLMAIRVEAEMNGKTIEEVKREHNEFICNKFDYDPYYVKWIEDNWISYSPSNFEDPE